MSTEISDADLEKTFIYHQLDEYPWNEDQEFQGGLRAILGSVQDPAQVEHLTLRAKCYYYARKAGSTVDFDGYKQWAESQRGVAPINGLNTTENSIPHNASQQDAVEEGGSGIGGMGDAPKPASFAEICDMIAEGKPIPGIKDIPDTVLEGQASDSQASKRKKPWEKDTNTKSDASAGPSWIT